MMNEGGKEQSMLPQMLVAFALVFAAAPVQAQSDADTWRSGIRVHRLGAREGEAIRVHGATHLADIPTHGRADAFQPSLIRVQRLHREPGETQIRVHGRDAFRPSRIPVHGLANP
jgi:hypothetical protein